jgi:hypothetical protein
MKTIIASLISCSALAPSCAVVAQKVADENPEVAAARKARDRASVEDLQMLIAKTRNHRATLLNLSFVDELHHWLGGR